MSKSTISTFELFAMFPTEDVARQYLEGRLWPNGPICPECRSGENVGARPKGYYRCYACDKLTFTVRTGTIFERSHIPLHKWVYAMYLLVTARKGISSMQLAKEIGVTQKSAWFMLSRLRGRRNENASRGMDAAAKAEAWLVKAGEAKSELRVNYSNLDKFVDVVLAYKPKPKTKAAKRRERKKKRDAAAS